MSFENYVFKSKSQKVKYGFLSEQDKKGFAEISRSAESVFLEMLVTYKGDHKVDLNPKLICFPGKNTTEGEKWTKKWYRITYH